MIWRGFTFAFLANSPLYIQRKMKKKNFEKQYENLTV